MLLATAGAALAVTVVSPDGQVRVQFDLKPSTGPVYSVTHHGKPVVLESKLAFATTSSRITAVKENRHAGEWKPLYAERSTIPDNWSEAVVTLDSGLAITLRAYNEGAAFRYTFASPTTITGERTEFRLPQATRAWETHGAQQQYENVWTSSLKPNVERPLVIEYPDGRLAAFAEAGLRDYSRMQFSPVDGQPNTLYTQLFDEKVTGVTTTPWRAIIVADRPGDLIERNYLLLNLCPPPVAGDYSWIRPGKVIREVTLSTKGAKEAVDFAAARGLRYIEFDAGWYGHEYEDASDATGVHVDPLRLQKDPAYQGLDLPEVIAYGKQKGIGVWLYVNRRALEKQLPTLLPLYEKWGVKGVKYGFVNVGSQQWTKWLYDAVELAGKHHLMVDIHDEHRPTGLSRTYPWLLTQEGILGNEGMPPSDHNTVLPFTRFVAGAADYTICYYVDRVKTTRAHQLAIAVVYYSPLQFMYWYDRPSDWKSEPETEFFDRVPTTWDDTKVVQGEIGRYITTARRSGNDWFVGTLNNGVPRRLTVPLTFLPAGRRFLAHIYENGRGGSKDVKMSTQEVDATSVIPVQLPPAGGQAIWLEAR